MRTLIVTILAGALFFVSPVGVEAKMKQAQFTFTNECSKTIQIDILNSSGKILRQRTVKPGREIAVGEVRRVMVHVDNNSREYFLPGILNVRPQTTNKTYVAMLGGKWRLSIKDSDPLDIVCVEGGRCRCYPI